eukprot:SAG31_NODE_1141_length_9699_cov_4.487604_2_plen_1169_part_00
MVSASHELNSLVQFSRMITTASDGDLRAYRVANQRYKAGMDALESKNFELAIGEFSKGLAGRIQKDVVLIEKLTHALTRARNEFAKNKIACETALANFVSGMEAMKKQEYSIAMQHFDDGLRTGAHDRETVEALRCSYNQANAKNTAYQAALKKQSVGKVASSAKDYPKAIKNFRSAIAELTVGSRIGVSRDIPARLLTVKSSLHKYFEGRESLDASEVDKEAAFLDTVRRALDEVKCAQEKALAARSASLAHLRAGEEELRSVAQASDIKTALSRFEAGLAEALDPDLPEDSALISMLIAASNQAQVAYSREKTANSVSKEALKSATASLQGRNWDGAIKHCKIGLLSGTIDKILLSSLRNMLLGAEMYAQASAREEIVAAVRDVTSIIGREADEETELDSLHVNFAECIQLETPGELENSFIFSQPLFEAEQRDEIETAIAIDQLATPRQTEGSKMVTDTNNRSMRMSLLAKRLMQPPNRLDQLSAEVQGAISVQSPANVLVARAQELRLLAYDVLSAFGIDDACIAREDTMRGDRRWSETSVENEPGDTDEQIALRTFELKLPADATAGEQLLVTTPDGAQVQVSVPEGLEPGGDNRMAVPYIQHTNRLSAASESIAKIALGSGHDLQIDPQADSVAIDLLATRLGEVQFLMDMALGQHNALSLAHGSLEIDESFDTPAAKLAARLQNLEALRYAAVDHYDVRAHVSPQGTLDGSNVHHKLADRLDELEALTQMAQAEYEAATAEDSAVDALPSTDTATLQQQDSSPAHQNAAEVGMSTSSRHDVDETTYVEGPPDPAKDSTMCAWNKLVHENATSGDRLLVTSPSQDQMQMQIAVPDLVESGSIAVSHVERRITLRRQESVNSASISLESEPEMQTLDLDLSADALGGQQQQQPVTTPDGGVPMQISVPERVGRGGDGQMTVPYLQREGMQGTQVAVLAPQMLSQSSVLRERLAEIESLKRAAVEEYAMATRVSWEPVSSMHQAPAEALAARLDELDALVQKALVDYAAAKGASSSSSASEFEHDGVDSDADAVDSRGNTYLTNQALASSAVIENPTHERRQSAASIEDDIFDSECEVVVRTFQVLVPNGAAAGDRLLVTAPDGRQMQVIVPLSLGQRTHFTVPYVHHGDNIMEEDRAEDSESVRRRIDRLAMLSSHDMDVTWR